MPRRGRMPRNDFQNAVQFHPAQPVAFLVVQMRRNGGNVFSEDFLVAAIVLREFELDLADLKIRLLIFGANRPARETARHFHDILLRVAAVDAQGVQLQQFTRVIFVWLFRHVLAAVDPPVEIPKHGRAEGGGAQHGGEFSKGVLANHLAVVRHFEPFAIAFGGINVEVVRPELDHHFIQLTFGPHRAGQRAAHQFVLQEVFLVLEQFTERFAKRFEPAHGVFRFFIINLLRTQLLFEVGRRSLFRRWPPFADPGIIAGTRTEGGTIQHMSHRINVLRTGRLERAPGLWLTVKEAQLARQLITANRRQQRSAAAADFQELTTRKVHRFIAYAGVRFITGGASWDTGLRSFTLRMNAPNPLTNAQIGRTNHPTIGNRKVRANKMPPRSTRRQGCCSSAGDGSPEPILRINPADPKSPNMAGSTMSAIPVIFSAGLGSLEMAAPMKTGSAAAIRPISVIFTGFA